MWSWKNEIPNAAPTVIQINNLTSSWLQGGKKKIPLQNGIKGEESMLNLVELVHRNVITDLCQAANLMYESWCPKQTIVEYR
jgi:hypothetical protein